MVHQIVYENGHKVAKLVTSRAEYLNIRNTSRQSANVIMARQGSEDSKKRLVQMNYSCLPNEDGTLKGATRVANSVGMDIDHLDADSLKTVIAKVLSQKDALGLLMMELSARGEGLHVVFKRHMEMSQEENLQWAGKVLGVEYDKAAKDITRVFFTTTGSDEDLLFLDDEIFSDAPYPGLKSVHPSSTEPGPFVSSETITPSSSHYGSGIVTAIPAGLKTVHPSSTEPIPSEEEQEQKAVTTPSPISAPSAERCGGQRDGQAEAPSYSGIPFSVIISKYWELFNDGREPQEGDRNVKTYELALAMRPLCDYDQQKMEMIIPCYDGFPETEWRKTIENAVKEPRKGMPYRTRQVLNALHTQMMKSVQKTDVVSTPPPMPKRLPKLIQLLTENVPDFLKPAVASGVFPSLALHMHGAFFRYWDNVAHKPVFMNVLIAPSSIGKGRINDPINYILADIKERDEISRQREGEWKRKNPSGKTKEKEPRPKDICVQILSSDCTSAAFKQRVIDAFNNGERAIYAHVNEIEDLKYMSPQSTPQGVHLLMRQSFDNDEIGQERVGADSVTGKAPLNWCFNASTTPVRGKKFLMAGVNDGTLGRLDLSTVVADENDIPIVKLYGDKYAEALKPYLENLEAANGEIECPQAKRLSEKMREENKELFKLYESEAFKRLSYRANVIAWQKGMLLYVAEGYKWGKAIEDFVRWSQAYDLHCKMKFFGDAIESEIEEETSMLRNNGPRNLLDLLPDEFSKEQYYQMRQVNGKKGSGESTLRTWASRGYIIYDDIGGMYAKSEEYLKRSIVHSA